MILQVFKTSKEEELEKAKSSTNPLYFELNWILLQGLICQRCHYTMKQPDLDKVADYLFQTEEWTMYELILFWQSLQLLRGGLCYTVGREVMEREDFYKEIGRHRKLVLILALNCYQHCLEHRSFENASYFEAYVERLSGKSIKLYERNIFHYLKDLPSIRRGKQKKGGSKCRKPCIF